MKKCPNCKREIESNSVYCEHCGQKIQKKSNSVWFLVGSLIVLAVAIVLFIIPKGKNGKMSADVFETMDADYRLSSDALSQQINSRIASFEQQYALDPEKAGPYWEQAQAMKTVAFDVVNQVDSLKQYLWTHFGNKAKYAPDESLFKVLQKSQQQFQELVPQSRSTMMLGGRNRAFDATLFSDMAWLNRMSLETQVTALNGIEELMTNIHTQDYSYDEVGAKVFAESGYLLSGQTYRAQAMVTAWQNTQTKAYVKLDGGSEKEYTSDGQGVINLDFNCGVGQHKYTGYIKMLDPSTNELKDFPFENTFTVAPPMVSVSASKMNVVYRGIDNPIAVGGGVGGEINATVSNGSLTRMGNGIYNLRPGEANEVTISVSSGGSSLGSMKFRVKDLPKPVAVIRNVVNSQVSKSALLAANRVEAEIKDFDFDGVKYDVVGYTFCYKTKAGTTKEVKANGSAFTDEMKTAISGSNVGDIFLFTAIQVRGNDGKVKTLDSGIGVEIK